jgi:hypothetical protein
MIVASTDDINCVPRNFLLFSAKDLVANDAARLNATIGFRVA